MRATASWRAAEEHVDEAAGGDQNKQRLDAHQQRIELDGSSRGDEQAKAARRASKEHFDAGPAAR